MWFVFSHVIVMQNRIVGSSAEAVVKSAVWSIFFKGRGNTEVSM